MRWIVGLAWVLGSASATAARPPICTVGKLPAGAYLLTVSPGDSVETVFGHTAVLILDGDQGAYSPVYDFGRYKVGPPVQQAWAVLNMEQEYYLGSRNLRDTLDRYESRGRDIIAQRLALDAAQTAALDSALSTQLNDDPFFPYNWYRPNCTTEVQERLDTVLGGTLRPQHLGPSGTSPAREVLRHSADLWPLWFGLHWGSGRIADVEVDVWDSMFLPEALMVGMRRSTNKTGAPLVASECLLVDADDEPVRAEAPNRDLVLGAIGLLWAACLGGLGRVRRGVGLVAVGAQGVAVGVFGAAAVLVGALGTFAPFWGHQNLAFASPLTLLLTVGAVLSYRDASSRAPVALAGLLGVVALLGMGASVLHGLADRNLGIALLMVPPLIAAGWILTPADD